MTVLGGGDTQKLIDEAYQRGFGDGVKWVVSGATVKLRVLADWLEKSARRVTPRAIPRETKR